MQGMCPPGIGGGLWRLMNACSRDAFRDRSQITLSADRSRTLPVSPVCLSSRKNPTLPEMRRVGLLVELSFDFFALALESLASKAEVVEHVANRWTIDRRVFARRSIFRIGEIVATTTG